MIIKTNIRELLLLPLSIAKRRDRMSTLEIKVINRKNKGK
jgi:hypothetical protein